jgi:uncharacterized membrane protein
MADWVSAFAAIVSALVAIVALAHSVRVKKNNVELAERVQSLELAIKNQTLATGGGGAGGFGGGRGGDGGSIVIGENRQ